MSICRFAGDYQWSINIIAFHGLSSTAIGCHPVHTVKAVWCCLWALPCCRSHWAETQQQDSTTGCRTIPAEEGYVVWLWHSFDARCVLRRCLLFWILTDPRQRRLDYLISLAERPVRKPFHKQLPTKRMTKHQSNKNTITNMELHNHFSNNRKSNKNGRTDELCCTALYTVQIIGQFVSKASPNNGCSTVLSHQLLQFTLSHVYYH